MRFLFSKYRVYILILSVFLSTGIFFSSSCIVFAHFLVKPEQVTRNTLQPFTVSIHNEKDNPTVAVRLVIPEGVTHVNPTAKTGWNVETKKRGEGDASIVTEITWTDGNIPAGQHDEFTFTAQVPNKEAQLAWKAYQTYEDGTVFSWDENIDKIKQMTDEQQVKLEEENKGAYSITKVDQDVKVPSVQKQTEENKLVLFIASAAVVLSLFSLGLQLSRKK